MMQVRFQGNPQIGQTLRMTSRIPSTYLLSVLLRGSVRHGVPWQRSLLIRLTYNGSSKEHVGSQRRASDQTKVS